MINLINTTFAHMGQVNEAGELTNYHFGMMNGTMGWFGFGLGWLFMLTAWALVVLGIVALAKYIRNNGKRDK